MRIKYFKVTLILLNIITLIFITSRSNAVSNYSIIDLGRGNVYGVNNYGHVIGRYPEGLYVWKDGVRINLGSLSGTPYFANTAFDISDSGQVIGQSKNASGFMRAFLWENEAMQALGTFTGWNENFAYGINELGQIVGRMRNSAYEDRAFIWDSSNGMQNFNELDGIDSKANDISNSSKVVGAFENIDGYDHAFLLDNGKLYDLDTLNGHNSSGATAINERGQIIGFSQVVQDGVGSDLKSFIWENGVMTELESPINTNPSAHGINDYGQVVGIYFENWLGGKIHGYLWENGVMHNLIELLDNNPGWEIITSGRAINDAGQIVGEGYVYGDSQIHGFLMTPIPPPEQVATPAFSPTPETYNCGQSIEITCSSSEAEIHYTVNGDDPTKISKFYNLPIKLKGTTTLKARAYKNGWFLSDIANGNYVIIDTDGDGTGDCDDNCPNDPNKIAPGVCGCGFPDTDSDGDGMTDCWEKQIIDADANDNITGIDNVLPGDDFDIDGWPNIMEYKRGTDPTDPNSHPSKAMPWLHLLLLDN